jgi:hypothetical protein
MVEVKINSSLIAELKIKKEQELKELKTKLNSEYSH